MVVLNKEEVINKIIKIMQLDFTLLFEMFLFMSWGRK